MMETELLIIKAGNAYVRVAPTGYTLCGLEKASVFPMEKLDTVRRHAAAMAEEQTDVVPSIFRLLLKEVPLDESGTR